MIGCYIHFFSLNYRLKILANIYKIKTVSLMQFKREFYSNFVTVNLNLSVWFIVVINLIFSLLAAW